jgi:crooked neck
MEASKLGGEDEEEEDERAPEEVDNGNPALARAVFERGYKDLKDRGEKEDRVVLLEAWKSFEETHGTAEDVAKVVEKMPKVMKKWRQAPGGQGLEECRWSSNRPTPGYTLTLEAIVVDWDMVFPDDEREANPASFKFFQAAQEWSRTQALADLSDSDSDSSDDDDEAEEREEEADGGGEPMEQDDEGEA